MLGYGYLNHKLTSLLIKFSLHKSIKKLSIKKDNFQQTTPVLALLQDTLFYRKIIFIAVEIDLVR